MAPGLWLNIDGVEALVFRDGLVMVMEDRGHAVPEGKHTQGDPERVDEYMTAARELLQPIPV